ncbi:hypothetical protein EYF80_064928 [Liparis tanakae]|uniref:Uncharacterized protein n=1 Tax=Liparis tanakae TaxID=230148 RepID=A0A4Z2E855_9TELE|nr:hypothetical protein EYF80_064928 [Liparis tanakae]
MERRDGTRAPHPAAWPHPPRQTESCREPIGRFARLNRVALLLIGRMPRGGRPPSSVAIGDVNLPPLPWRQLGPESGGAVRRVGVVVAESANRSPPIRLQDET